MVKEMKMSNQCIGAIMMTLQKAILKQESVLEMLREFRIKNSPDGLVVLNPPVVKFDDEPAEGPRQEATDA